MIDFDCPRCGTTVMANTYGPCEACREQLKSTQFRRLCLAPAKPFNREK